MYSLHGKPMVPLEDLFLHDLHGYGMSTIRILFFTFFFLFSYFKADVTFSDSLFSFGDF